MKTKTDEKKEGMTGCRRCLHCQKIPTVKIETITSVYIECPTHGHMAKGDTLEMAVKHWNLYLGFYETKAVA